MKRPQLPDVRRFGARLTSGAWLRRITVGVAGAAVASLGLAAFVYGPPLVQAIADHPYFAVAEIVMTPTHHVRAGTLLEAVELRPGMSLWRVDPGGLAQRLEAQPWIRRASVRREFPRRLVVDLTERQPAAILFLDQLYYVDGTGVAFVRVGERDPLDLPFVTGVEAAIVADERPFARHAIRQALRLLRSMEAVGLPFRVSEVHIDREQGVTVFPIEPRVALTFGWSGFGTKLMRLRRVLDDFRGREAQLREIDLTMGTEAVVRMRQSGGRARGRRPGTDAPGVKRTPMRGRTASTATVAPRLATARD
jgi:cell division protein FtsQ